MEITMSMNPDKSWDTSDVLVFMKGAANYNGKKNIPNSAFSYRDFERWCALWMIWFWCDLYFVQERQHCRCYLPDLADAFIHKPSTLQVFAGGVIEVPCSWSLPQQMEYPWPWYANYELKPFRHKEKVDARFSRFSLPKCNWPQGWKRRGDAPRRWLPPLLFEIKNWRALPICL